MRKTFPNYRQIGQMDCGPTCLKIVSQFYGRRINIERLRELSGFSKIGVSLLGISEAAENLGFRTTGLRLSCPDLREIDLPCILHWSQGHFVVLYRISKSVLSKEITYHISDPAGGLKEYRHADFTKHWCATSVNDELTGIALVLTPSPVFYESDDEPVGTQKLVQMFRYLFKYKSLLVQLGLGLGIGTIIQLTIPFLAKSIVDVGIFTKNLAFVYVIVFAQAALSLGRISVDFIRSWILLHITSRLNLSILTDFLIKLLKLPMSFFETRQLGDIMQRISDQGRIQAFLTGTSLSTAFSVFNVLVFSAVLAHFHLMVFSIHIIGTVMYALWTMIFLRMRQRLELKRFAISSANQSGIAELIGGIQEIKLNNCEQRKRWDWEKIQAKLFKFSMKSLSLSQFQQTGSFFINETKNIIVTFIVAKSVIDGTLTLGEMIAIQYIVGQINSPTEQLLTFLQQYQDAKISLERLNEVHELKDEEPANERFIMELPEERTIRFQNVSFAYPGNDAVLENLTFDIPCGKTTAIVGSSGSGKTTILKLLLRFHERQRGEIRVGDELLDNIGYRFWRSKCGTVMQDGFIFSDTVAKNIAVVDEFPDRKRLLEAIKLANLTDLIETLPLGLKTKIGAGGQGISQGQKQRLLIARAIYKNPEFIFFDEATNSLDSTNERVIMENLEAFFQGRTVVVVAHRLSTIRNAANIVVVEQGKIKEQGTHHQLVKSSGYYYDLVRNQLESVTHEGRDS